MNHPEVTQAALKILRSGQNFQWYVITLLALVLYVYANEIRQRNWKGIAAGLSLYMVHWLVEIINALIVVLHKVMPPGSLQKVMPPWRR